MRVLGMVGWCVTGNARMIEGMGIIHGQSELELIGLGLAGGDRLWDRAFVSVPAVLVACLKRWGTRGILERIRAWTNFLTGQTTWTLDILGPSPTAHFSLQALLTTATFGSTARTVRTRRVLGWCRIRCTNFCLIPQAGAMGWIIVR